MKRKLAVTGLLILFAGGTAGLSYSREVVYDQFGNKQESAVWKSKDSQSTYYDLNFGVYNQMGGQKSKTKFVRNKSVGTGRFVNQDTPFGSPTPKKSFFSRLRQAEPQTQGY